MKFTVRLLIAWPFLLLAATLAWAFNDPPVFRDMWRFVRYGAVALLALILAGCAGYRGPGTYDGACYTCATNDPSVYQLMMGPPPPRWAPPPYPGGPLFRSQ